MKKIIILLLLMISLSIPSLNAKERECQTIDVFVTNAPKEYYLDILFYSDSQESKNDLSSFEEGMIKLIEEYNDEEYNSSFVKGSEKKLTGNIKMEEATNERTKHTFVYDFLEGSNNYEEALNNRISEFRIIICIEDEVARVSDPIVITEISSTISYNYKTNEFVTQAPTANIFSFAIIIALIILLLDSFLLLGFGNSISKNIKKILLLSFFVPMLLSALVAYSIYFDIYDFALKNLILLSIFYLAVSMVCCPLMYKNEKFYKKLLYGFIISVIFFLINFLGLIIIK